MRHAIKVDLMKPIGDIGEQLVNRLIDRAVKNGDAALLVTTEETVTVHTFPMVVVDAAIRAEKEAHA